MKKWILLSAALLLAMAIPAMAQEPQPATAPRQSSADVLRELQQKMREKQFAMVVARAKQALESPGVTPADKAKLLRFAADASAALGKGEGVRAAVGFHERIVGDATIVNTARLDSLKAMAEIHIASLAGLELSQMDLAPAHAILQRALTLENLTPEDRAAALCAIGDLFMREDKHLAARAEYEKAAALPVGEKTKAIIQRELADTFISTGEHDRALAIYREQKFDLIPLFSRIGPAQRLREECARVLDDPASSDAAKWGAFRALPVWDGSARDLPAIREAGEKYLPALAQQTPARLLTLLPYVKQAKIGADAGFILWAAPLLLAAPNLGAGDYTFVRTAVLESLATTGKIDAAIESAKSISADAKVTPSTRAWADLVLVALSTPAITQPALTAALARHAALTEKEKATVLLAAARTALRANAEPPARLLHAAYLALLAPAPRAKLTCNFLPDVPSDIGGWLASPALLADKNKAPLDRPYGDNLRFLVETDSAMTGRETAEQSEKLTDDSRSELQMLCDAEGLHVFIKAYDTQVEQAVAGTVRGGGLEMYLAPGERQAYYTFIGTLPQCDFHPESFVTAYPNPQYRTLSTENNTFRTQARPIKDAIVTYLFLSWETFYDKLPENGSAWQFEAIRWTRNGGFSFGGSKSVHNRSSWGDIVFANLTRENLTAIKRRIIAKAIPRYRKVKDSIGAAGNWADPDLGDPAFFKAKVQPRIATLDQYVLRSNKGMNDQDVEEIFKDAVPGWMELEFEVAAQRRQFLEERLMGK